MLVKTFTLFGLTLSALAVPYTPAPGDRTGLPTLPTLPACDETPRPCSCPPGTFFQESTSYAFFAASAADVTRITGDFLNTAWFGTSPTEVTGSGHEPGAKRVLLGEIPEAGVFSITEKLTSWTPYPNNGGYFMKFQMDDAPFYYSSASGPGILGGTWDMVDVRSVGPRKTYMLWNIYACFSSTFDFKGFHESAMNNVTAILKNEGRMRGETVGPISF